MRARLLWLTGLAATVALVAATVAFAAFGDPETADPEKPPDDFTVSRDRQLVADAAGNAYWLSRTSEADAALGPIVFYSRCGAPPKWERFRRAGHLDGVPIGIAVAPDGFSMHFWYEDNGADRTFWSWGHRRAPDGVMTFGAASEIVTTVQTSLDFAMSDDGGAVAAWVDAHKVRTSTRSDQGWSDPETLDQNAESARVAMDADGDAVVLVYGNGQERAYYRTAGSPWGGPQTIENLPFAVLPESQQVEFDGAGRPVAVYSQQGRLHASIRSGGTWQATPTSLDDAHRLFIAPLVRHPDGLVVAWSRVLSQSNSNAPLAVARLRSSGWEDEHVYSSTQSRLITPTLSAAANGQILLAANKLSGPFETVEEIWGTTVDSIDAPWPADLARLSPVSDPQHRYRRPDSAAGGNTFFLAFGVYGGPDTYSQVIATGPANPCFGDAGSPTPTPTPTVTPSPTPDNGGPPPQPVPPPGGSSTTTKPKAPGIARLLAFPKASKCVRGRKLALRLRPPPAGVTVDEIAIRVNGKRAKVRRAGRILRVRGLPRRRFKLEARLTLADGRLVKGSRRYRPCR